MNQAELRDGWRWCCTGRPERRHGISPHKAADCAAIASRPTADRCGERVPIEGRDPKTPPHPSPCGAKTPLENQMSHTSHASHTSHPLATFSSRYALHQATMKATLSAPRLKGYWKLLVKFLVAKLIFIHFLPLLQIPRREVQGRRTAPP